MKMTLGGWKVSRLSFVEKAFTAENAGEGKFNFETRTLFADRADSDVFAIEFSLKMDDPSFDLDITAKYDFRVLDGVVDDSFKSSNFPKVNAPAIAFPYLRAFISNLTLQAGYKPIVLPSINFNKLAEAKPKVATEDRQDLK